MYVDKGSETGRGVDENFKLEKISGRSIEMVTNLQPSHEPLKRFELYGDKFIFISIENRNF